MCGTWNQIENTFGLTQQQLNDPCVAIKIKNKITRERPPEFKYLSKYRKLSKAQKNRIMEQECHKLASDHFHYKIAKAQEEKYCEDEDRRIKRKVMVLEATDREFKVKFQYEVDQEPNIHVLFIGNKNPQKSAGYYKVKKSMLRFREMILEGNKKEYAWGRSLASTYPVKLNRKRWPDTDGDWRRQPARIKNKYGKRSEHIDRLAGFYLRTGLWIPIDWENHETQGIKIVMPSSDFFDKMVSTDKDCMEELLKFSKDEFNKYNK